MDTHDTNNKINLDKLWTRNFLLITFANLFTFLGFQMLLPVMPAYAIELGGTEVLAGMVTGIFTISSVTLRPFAGRLLDQKGRKSIFLSGLLLFIFCVVAYNWVPSVILLLIFRFIHGFGWGATSTASSTIATDVIPKPRMGEGMGYFGLTSTFAMAIGPAISLSLLSRYTYSIIFTISASLVIIAFLFALLIRYRKPERESAGTDTKFATISEKKLGIIEKSALKPGVIIGFITMSYGAIVTFIPLYAAQRRIVNIGIFFTVYAIALLISRPAFGIIIDRKGYSFAVFPGLIAVFSALIILFFSNSLVEFLLAGIMYGLGFGALQPALQTMAVRDVGPARRGAANATFFIGFDSGIGVGSILWGVVSSAIGYQSMYLCATFTIVVAFFIYLRCVKTRG